jgi:hypothetical protein
MRSFIADGTVGRADLIFDDGPQAWVTAESFEALDSAATEAGRQVSPAATPTAPRTQPPPSTQAVSDEVYLESLTSFVNDAFDKGESEAQIQMEMTWAGLHPSAARIVIECVLRYRSEPGMEKQLQAALAYAVDLMNEGVIPDQIRRKLIQIGVHHLVATDLVAAAEASRRRPFMLAMRWVAIATFLAGLALLPFGLFPYSRYVGLFLLALGSSLNYAAGGEANIPEGK